MKHMSIIEVLLITITRKAEFIMDSAKKMAQIAYNAMEDKKAEDIRIIEIGEISTIADYFIIANGTNSSQVQALVDGVDEALSKEGFEPQRIEGNRSSNWILMDYGDIVIHVFSKEDRLFYDLERIWRDGKTLSVEDLQ